MKNGIAIALIALAGLILAGCASDSELEPGLEPGPEPARGIVSGIPWLNSEFTGYTIRDYEGNDIGTAILTIDREDDTYVLKQQYAFGQAASVYIVRVRADNLKPIAGGVTTTDLGPVVLYTYEEEGKLKIDTSTSQEERHTVVIDAPKDAYDDSELLFLLRTMPFEAGYTTNFINMVATSAQKQVVTVTVIGEEKLQVPAGSFDAYKVEISIAGDKIYLWYGKDKPHYLLKQDTGNSVFLLGDIIEE